MTDTANNQRPAKRSLLDEVAHRAFLLLVILAAGGILFQTWLLATGRPDSDFQSPADLEWAYRAIKELEPPPGGVLRHSQRLEEAMRALAGAGRDIELAATDIELDGLEVDCARIVLRAERLVQLRDARLMGTSVYILAPYAAVDGSIVDGALERALPNPTDGATYLKLGARHSDLSLFGPTVLELSSDKVRLSAQGSTTYLDGELAPTTLFAMALPRALPAYTGGLIYSRHPETKKETAALSALSFLFPAAGDQPHVKPSCDGDACLAYGQPSGDSEFCPSGNTSHFLQYGDRWDVYTNQPCLTGGCWWETTATVSTPDRWLQFGSNGVASVAAATPSAGVAPEVEIISDDAPPPEFR